MKRSFPSWVLHLSTPLALAVASSGCGAAPASGGRADDSPGEAPSSGEAPAPSDEVPAVPGGPARSSPDGGGEEASPEPPGAPSEREDGVMLQGFFWDVPQRTAEGTWWQHLSAQVPALAAAGVTALWIPPPYKGGAGGYDVGYGVYDRYDLGEFAQKGSVATRYGTLAQLQELVRVAHGRGVRVYADIVMNHMMGADERESFSAGGRSFSVFSRFVYRGRGGRYSSFTFDRQHFNGCDQGGWQQWSPWDFQPGYGGDAWDNLLGCELRLRDPAVRRELVAWGQWITRTLELDGYRIDAVKHMETSFVREWLDAVRGPRFAVSEAWFGSLANLEAYARELGDRTHFFDVPLHYTFHAMSNGNGAWDMRGLRAAGFSQARPALSVPFVDNHDTVVDGGLRSPVTNLKSLAYAYILTRAGVYPALFYPDYFDRALRPDLDRLLRIRRERAGGAGAEHRESDADVYVYSRAGDGRRSGFVLLLNDGGPAVRRVRTPFPGRALVEVGGHDQARITTDAEGFASLPVGARTWAVWAPEGGSAGDRRRR